MRNILRSTRARRGATVVELLVGASVLALTLGSASLLWSGASGAHRDAGDQTRAELQLRRTLDRLAGELTMASRTSLLPAPDAEFGTSELVFQQLLDIQNGSPVLGPLASLRHDVASGELVFTRNLGEADEQRLVLCRRVSRLAEGEQLNGEDDNGNGLRDEAGFNVSLNGEILTLRLTVENPGPDGAPIQRTLETSLRLRN